jgi:hypothetical protein
LKNINEIWNNFWPLNSTIKWTRPLQTASCHSPPGAHNFSKSQSEWQLSLIPVTVQLGTSMSASTSTKVKHNFDVAFLPSQSIMSSLAFHEQSSQMLQ